MPIDLHEHYIEIACDTREEYNSSQAFNLSVKSTFNHEQQCTNKCIPYLQARWYLEAIVHLGSNVGQTRHEASQAIQAYTYCIGMAMRK
jgi:hypothetical protein